jgi:uncharacterized protein YcbK (DUF882 family)
MGSKQFTLASMLVILGWGATSTAASEPEARQIEFRHIWTGERLQVVYKTGDVYDPAAMAKIDWMFRDWRCKKSIPIDPALIDLLYDLYRELGSKGPIRVLSGYRSEGLNASLLRSGRAVEPHSQHMAGKAADVIFSGAPLSKLRDAAVARRAGGVGYYPLSRPGFVHVDTGMAREWEERPGGGRRGRLKLDCNLTIADALKEVALAVAPPGANASPDPAASGLERMAAHSPKAKASFKATGSRKATGRSSRRVGPRHHKKKKRR